MIILKLLKEQTKTLTSILEQLDTLGSLEDKLLLLEKNSDVILFLEKDHPISNIYPKLTEIEKMAVLSIVIIGQSENIFRVPKHLSDTATRFKDLLKKLTLYNQFYQDIGGIIGYHLEVVKLILAKEEEKDLSQIKQIHQAEGTPLHENLKKTDQAVIEGIKSLPMMGEIYPIGGAGDRLGLTDETTGLPLPTAKLNYLGQSLLSCMVKDLQAREYLYFKIFDKQILTPIAMMTSEAKNNHQFVEQICKANHWYHRPIESYKLFKQPLAPVIAVDGTWAMTDHLKLFLKPSGHGVIWKLAKELKVLDWFDDQKRAKALVRQMNNPMAGTDNGILALIGIGCSQNKAFGFASCQRLLNTAEGVNVLTEEKRDGKVHYTISNIEYTEFDKYKLKDLPNSPNSPYSAYPSNTNILFVDFHEIEKALQTCTIPGMLINMKTDVPILDENGKKKMIKGGRLESTMQNIADYMTDCFDTTQTLDENLKLKTFLTYNVRRKTISVAKKTYKEGLEINETPEGCYYTLMQNNFELLSKYCQLQIPNLVSTEEFLKKGPSLHFLFHPSLGPIYSIIQQKLQKGEIKEGSELFLMISELEIYNLNLSGSLLIEAKTPMGHLNENNHLVYSDLSAKCSLINVTIENRGIDHTQSNCYWKNQIHRHEKCHIVLEENAEFFAQDVTLSGEYDILVPKNTRLVASKDSQNKVIFTQKNISKPTWKWKYEINAQNEVTLKKEIS